MRTFFNLTGFLVFGSGCWKAFTLVQTGGNYVGNHNLLILGLWIIGIAIVLINERINGPWGPWFN